MVLFAGRSFEADASRVHAWGAVTPEDLRALSTMPNLRALNLNTKGITDNDLEIVGQLTTLEDLDVSTTDITDIGVCHLRGLTRMRHLRIKETMITDVGIGYLAPMSGLETLNIKRVDITDTGIHVLGNHIHLNQLILSDGIAEGRFSHAALTQLQRRLPACEIVLGGRVFPY